MGACAEVILWNDLISDALVCGSGGSATLITKSITENGTYRAVEDGADGYDIVNVNVPDRYDVGYQDGYHEGYDNGYQDGKTDGKDYRDYMQGLIDNQAGTPNPDRCKDTERSMSSGKTYTLSLSDTTYRKPNNWSWLDFHITVNDDDGNIVYDKDCTSYDNKGGTNFLLPYIDTVDGQLRMYYPVVSGSQWTGYIQTWSWIILY